MKQTSYILVSIFVFSLTSYGQLISTGRLPDVKDYSTDFKIDTLRISTDSIFLRVQKIENGILIFDEEQIFIESENQKKIIMHGLSINWYPNGDKKSEGRFRFDIKKGLWKYWDKQGNLTLDIDKESYHLKFRNHASKYYIDGTPVNIRE